MMRIFLVLLVAFMTALPMAHLHARTESIAAVVNDDVISMSDLNDRVRLIMASSGLRNTADIRSKIANQVINSLIEEQLKLQEARRMGLEISEAEVQQGFATIAQQNNAPPEKFANMLRSGGINLATMYRQIRSQIAWSKVVQAELRPRIIVSDKDIDNRLDRLTGGKGQKEYLVAEIFLPVDDPKNENNSRQLANKLISEINGGKAPFFKVAQQFSKAAGAAQGGDLGWVTGEQLDDKLSQALQTMKKETISQPIRSASGYHILFLRDLRTVTDESLPSREEIMSQVGLERLQRAAERYLLDLKAAAFVENRVQS